MTAPTASHARTPILIDTAVRIRSCEQTFPLMFPPGESSAVVDIDTMVAPAPNARQRGRRRRTGCEAAAERSRNSEAAERYQSSFAISAAYASMSHDGGRTMHCPQCIESGQERNDRGLVVRRSTEE